MFWVFFPDENQRNSSYVWKDCLIKYLFTSSTMQYYTSKKKNKVRIWFGSQISVKPNLLTTPCADICAVSLSYNDLKSNQINLQI